MQLTIPVVARLQDGGDGGWSIRIYNNEDELIDDHYANRDKNITPERRAAILSEEDPYEDGYICQGTVDVTVDPVTGVARINSPLYFHAGQ